LEITLEDDSNGVKQKRSAPYSVHSGSVMVQYKYQDRFEH